MATVMMTSRKTTSTAGTQAASDPEGYVNPYEAVHEAVRDRKNTLETQSDQARQAWVGQLKDDAIEADIQMDRRRGKRRSKSQEEA